MVLFFAESEIFKFRKLKKRKKGKRGGKNRKKPQIWRRKCQGGEILAAAFEILRQLSGHILDKIKAAHRLQIRQPAADQMRASSPGGAARNRKTVLIKIILNSIIRKRRRK